MEWWSALRTPRKKVKGLRTPGKIYEGLRTPGKKYEGFPCDKKTIDDQGGELSVPSYGFTLTIPPGALKEGTSKEMTLQVLTEIPDDIHVRKNETIVSYGYECHPSGIQFRQPVSLVIPHCAVIGDPRKVKTALYSWNDLSKGAIRYSHKKIKCKVSKVDLTLNLEHFSGGFLAFLKKRVVKGKLMSCMPYLPNTMPSTREPVLEVRLVNKPPGTQWEKIHEHDDDKRPVKRTDDEVFVEWRDMTVSCQLDEEKAQSKIVSHRSLRHKTKYTVYFVLNFCAGQKFNRNVTLTLEQKYEDTIIFPTTFEEQSSQVRSFQECSAHPPQASIDIQGDPHSQTLIKQAKEDDTETSSSNENVMPKTLATSSSIRKHPGARPKTRTWKSEDLQRDRPLTSEDLTNLSAIFPHDKFNRLSEVIYGEYNTGQGILAKHKDDYQKAVKEILEAWRDRAPRKRADLDYVLDKAGLAGLCRRF